MTDKQAFLSLGLEPRLLHAIESKGFEEPTEVQEMAIPVLLRNDTDIIAQAQTGTGKTAAFALPLIQLHDSSSKNVQAIVLAPTRELAVQVKDEIDSLCEDSKIRTLAVYGGQSIDRQLKALKKGVDIVVGTPGRVIDHLKRKTLNLQSIEHLILDEADEMLNMGFIEDLEVILAETNPNKRTCLFSATMPKKIRELAKKYMQEAVSLKVESKSISTEKIEQNFIEVKSRDKVEALCRYLDYEENTHCIIFCRTRMDVDQLSDELNSRGYEAEGIHGEISQAQREKTWQNFRNHKLNTLVATDVAARGIDVNDVTHVINFSIPNDPETYIHRIGRTGRAGKDGKAVTFIIPSEFKKLMFIQRITKMKIEKIALPEVKDLIDRKKKNFERDLANTDSASLGDDYYNWAKALLQEYHPSVLSAYLLKQLFSENLNPDSYAVVRDPASKGSRGSYEDARETSQSRDGKTARLFVTLGKRDEYNSRKLVDLIANAASMKNHQIDDVAVMDNYSFVTVPTNKAELLISKLKRKGNQPICSYVRDRKDGHSQRKSFRRNRRRA